MATSKTTGLSDELHAYVVAHGTPPDPVLTRLIERTSELGRISGMQIAPEQGTFLTMLAKLVDAKLIVEVGTFTGYSSICLARGLSSGGNLICCDISQDFTAIARDAWIEAGVADQIELRLAPAAETLAALDKEIAVDLAFIDADKTGYAAYYELILERLRPGGIIAIDNVLWSGRVIEAEDTSADTQALRELNKMIAADARVEVVMLSIADGLTLARKK